MRGWLVIAALLALLASACTDTAEPSSAPNQSRDPSQTASENPSETAAAEVSESPSPDTGDGGTSESPAQPPSPEHPQMTEAVHPVSLPALFDKKYDGRRLRLGQVRVRTDAYTQRAVTYRGDGLTLSGIMNIPAGKGPFPVLVLAHGYIDPDIYVTGQGLRREQDWLARAGYVVLHVDYRNHAGSGRDPRAGKRLRLDYATDVINAVRAVRRSGLRFVDPERVGLLGRSMGGGVVYNVLVVAPGLVDAAVVFAPVSSRAGQNFNRWIRDDAGRSRLSRNILRDYGAPEDRPEFWRKASARTYFDRITEPLLIHHGTADESVPLRWSRATYAALQGAGVDVRLFVYPGEPHAFIDDWPLSMRRTVRFFERNIG